MVDVLEALLAYRGLSISCASFGFTKALFLWLHLPTLAWVLSFGFHRSPLLCALVRLCILCPVFGLCWYLWPFACFCKNLMFNISFGCCRHSVSNTFVQLTEGRSARDQPKQPPAKKTEGYPFPLDAQVLHTFSLRRPLRQCCRRWLQFSQVASRSRI